MGTRKIGERGLRSSGRAEAGKEGPRLRGSDGVSAHKHAIRSARLSPLPGRHDRSATTASRQALVRVTFAIYKHNRPFDPALLGVQT